MDAVKSSFLIELLESVPDLKSRLKAPRTIAQETTQGDWLSEATQAVAVVQVY